MDFVSSWQLLLYNGLKIVASANTWVERVPVGVLVTDPLTTEGEMATRFRGVQESRGSPG